MAASDSATEKAIAAVAKLRQLDAAPVAVKPAAPAVPLWAKMVAGGIAGVIGTSLILYVGEGARSNLCGIDQRRLFRRAVACFGRQARTQRLSPRRAYGSFPTRSFSLARALFFTRWALFFTRSA